MKKILLILAILLTITLCSCSNSNKNPSNETTNPPAAQNTTSTEKEQNELSTAEMSDDTLENIVSIAVTEAVNKLNTSFSELQAQIDTFDKYKKDSDKTDAYYASVISYTEQFGITMRELSVAYAEKVLSSDISADEMYDKFDNVYDCIYDDASDDFFDDIYDDLFYDLYNYFYDGLIDDAYDQVSYKEWSQLRSDEYKRWSDTRSDVYEEWTDYRSDIYEFWTDVNSELWNDDIEGASKEVAKFKTKIEKIKKLQQESSAETKPVSAGVSPTNKDIQTTAPVEDLVNGMRPEFTEALNAYEDFYDEYVDFMNAYVNSDNALSMLADYASYAAKLVEMNKKFEAVKDDDLNDAELAYYLEVQARVVGKLAKVQY